MPARARRLEAVPAAVTRLAAERGVPAEPNLAGLLHLVALGAGDAADRALACRLAVEELARRRPGRSVELRVPPYAAAQLGSGREPGPGAGPRHTRGTPPAVVECDPATFVALATGQVTYAEAVASRRLTATGAHSDLGDLFPLW